MNRLSRVCVLSTMLILLLPGLALAGTGGGDSTINLASGTVQAWTATALGVARSLLLFLFVISFGIEAFGRGPGAQRDLGAVVWRLLIAMVLLAGYSTIFGSIAQYSSTIAERIAPQATWDKLGSALKAFTEARAKMQLDGLVNADGVFDFAKKALAAHSDLFSVIPFLDIFVTIIITVGQAAMWVVVTLGNVLTLLLYILGPLAIAGAVPRGSDVGGRWFRLYISILSWPIIASLLVGLVTEFALQGLKPASPDEALFRSVGVAGLLCLASLAVPTIASGLIGGSLHAIGAGAATAALAGGMALKAARGAVEASGLGHVIGGIGSSAAGGAGGRQDSWVSREAFDNWCAAHPGSSWSTPEARQQLLEEQARLEEKYSSSSAPAPAAASGMADVQAAPPRQVTRVLAPAQALVAAPVPVAPAPPVASRQSPERASPVMGGVPSGGGQPPTPPTWTTQPPRAPAPPPKPAARAPLAGPLAPGEAYPYVYLPEEPPEDEEPPKPVEGWYPDVYLPEEPPTPVVDPVAAMRNSNRRPTTPMAARTAVNPPPPSISPVVQGRKAR